MPRPTTLDYVCVPHLADFKKDTENMQSLSNKKPLFVRRWKSIMFVYLFFIFVDLGAVWVGCIGDIPNFDLIFGSVLSLAQYVWCARAVSLRICNMSIVGTESPFDVYVKRCRLVTAGYFIFTVREALNLISKVMGIGKNARIRKIARLLIISSCFMCTNVAVIFLGGVVGLFFDPHFGWIFWWFSYAASRLVSSAAQIMASARLLGR